MTSYHFSVTVSGDFEDVVERVKAAFPGAEEIT